VVTGVELLLELLVEAEVEALEEAALEEALLEAEEELVDPEPFKVKRILQRQTRALSPAQAIFKLVASRAGSKLYIDAPDKSVNVGRVELVMETDVPEELPLNETVIAPFVPLSY
jgi:hypothetical protein